MVLRSDLRASKETKVMKDRRRNRMDREQLTYDTISSAMLDSSADFVTLIRMTKLVKWLQEQAACVALMGCAVHPPDVSSAVRGFIE